MHTTLAPSLLCVQVLYALTAGIAGYVSAVQYKTMGGTNWVCTSLLCCLSCMVVNKLDGILTHLMHFLLDGVSTHLMQPTMYLFNTIPAFPTVPVHR